MQQGPRLLSLEPLIAIDQFFNTLIPAPLEGFGHADEMISARAWRLRHSETSFFWRNLYHVIDFLFFWEKGGHCLSAFNDEVSRKGMNDIYRGIE